MGGFATRLLLLLRWSQRLWPVEYGWGRPLLTAGLGALATLAYIWIAPTELRLQIGAAVALFLGYLIAMWAICLTKDERVLVLRAIHDGRHALQILARGN